MIPVRSSEPDDRGTFVSSPQMASRSEVERIRYERKPGGA